MSTVAPLAARFAAPGIAIDAGAGGLTRVAIDRGGVAGEVFLHGATVTRWRPPGARDVLWTSAKSRWQADAPIRGGIPICFPWFGPHPTRAELPAHGFARVLPWTLAAVEPLAQGARVTLTLGDDERTRAQWPHRFRLRLAATFGARFEAALTASVEGDEVACGAALHTYLAVGDVRGVAIRGLGGATYIDKMRDAARVAQDDAPLRIVAETDRVYLARDAQARVEDPAWKRTLAVDALGAGAAVVWNPWIEKAKRMPDFGDEEWPGMLCLETANVADAAWKLGREERTMTARIAIA